MKPEDIAGPAAVKALQDAGYTLVGPKEQKRIVTMEESRGRFEKHVWRKEFPVVEEGNVYPVLNVADDWLVKTVNRRIVDTIVPVTGQFCSVNREYLLRLFCGEGA